LSSHNVGLPVTNDRIGVTVDHISKLNDKQWVLHKNKLAQVTDYNSVNLITDEGIVSVNLNELVLTTIKD
jgi:acyl CoA:acetate/3-ketoacid CoA transferase beta subunit